MAPTSNPQRTKPQPEWYFFYYVLVQKGTGLFKRTPHIFSIPCLCSCLFSEMSIVIDGYSKFCTQTRQRLTNNKRTTFSQWKVLTHLKFTENPISRRLCFDFVSCTLWYKGKNFEHSLPRDRHTNTHVYRCSCVCVHTHTKSKSYPMCKCLRKNVKQSCVLNHRTVDHIHHRWCHTCLSPNCTMWESEPQKRQNYWPKAMSTEHSPLHTACSKVLKLIYRGGLPWCFKLPAYGHTWD